MGQQQEGKKDCKEEVSFIDKVLWKNTMYFLEKIKNNKYNFNKYI